MSDQKDETVVLDLDNNYSYDYGAAGPSYAISSSGLDTITLGPLTTSITVPSSTYTTNTMSYTSGAGYTLNNYSYDPAVNITSDGITMKAGADIKVGDKSLLEVIDKIEERLGILKPNPELEGRWEKLKELRQQYMELEKDLLEKEKIMKILKET